VAAPDKNIGGTNVKKQWEQKPAYPIWIDHTKKIVSFKPAEGFERLDFSSKEEKIAFAVEKCSSGYRVQ